MTLENKKIKDTYKGILNLNDTNTELSTSLQSVKDGAGNESALKIATNKVGISDYVFPLVDGAANQVLGTDGNGNLDWVNTTVINWAAFGNSIIPATDETYDLGSPTKKWRDVHVGAGSLYVNGQQVLSDDSGTIVVKADTNQNLSIKTLGTGDLELAAEGSGALRFKSDITIQNGFMIYSSNSEIDFGDDINMNLQRIKNLAAPVSAGDAARKADVDAITLAYTPLNKAGDSMIGALAMGNNKITGLGEPTSGTDATTKNYVDNAVAGLKWKDPVKAATTANITLNSNTIIDGISVVSGDRVLVKNQTNATQNGIYVVVGAGGWTRATDADNTPGAELGGGTAVFVQNGTVNGGVGFVVTSPAGTANLGTDNITWAAFTGATALTAGDGLQSSGNTLSVNSTVVRTTGNQTIDGFKTFNNNVAIENTDPSLYFYDTNAGTNLKRWYIAASDGVLSVNQVTDAGAYLAQAAIIEPNGATSTSNNTVITREKGDARYAQLSASNTFSTGYNGIRIHSDTFPRLVLKHTDGPLNRKTWQTFINDGDNNLIISQINDAESASIVNYVFEVSAPTLSYGESVVRRDAGDARYAQLSAANTFTLGINIIGAAGAQITLNTSANSWNISRGAGVSGEQLQFLKNTSIQYQMEETGGLNTPFSIVNRTNGDARYAQISNNALLLNRVDSGNEGGEIIFRRSSDNANYLTIDLYNDGIRERLRIHEISPYSPRGTFDPPGTSTIDNTTVITREKGDGRYLQLAGGTITASANPGIYYNALGNVAGAKVWQVFNGTDGIFRLRHTTDNFASIVTDYNFELDGGANGPNSVIRRATGDIRYTLASDINLKEDIGPAPLALPLIEQLNPVSFKWKADEEHKTNIGLIAQQVQEVLPTGVKEMDYGLALDPANLIGLLIKAVKELSEKVKRLEGE